MLQAYWSRMHLSKKGRCASNLWRGCASFWKRQFVFSRGRIRGVQTISETRLSEFVSEFKRLRKLSVVTRWLTLCTSRSPTVARVYAATFEPVTRVLRSDRLCQFSLPSFPCVLSFSFVRSILFRFFLPRVSFSHLSLFTTFWGMLFTHYVYSYHTDCTMTYSTYIVIRYSAFSLTHLACFPHAESLHCHYIVPLTLATMSFTVDIVASDTPRKFIAHENKFLIGLCEWSAPGRLHDWLSH